MPTFNADTGTLGEVKAANASIQSSLEAQIADTQKLIELQRQLKNDVGASSRRRSRPAQPDDDFSLAPSRFEPEDNLQLAPRNTAAQMRAVADMRREISIRRPHDFDLAAARFDNDTLSLAPRSSDAEKRSRFDRILDDSIRKRANEYQAKTRGAADINARQLGHGPHELLALLQGDVSIRSGRGLANVAGFAAGNAGLKSLAAAGTGIAEMLGPLVAGGAGAGALIELIRTQFQQNIEEHAKQGDLFRERFRKAFSGDPGQDTLRNEVTKDFKGDRSFVNMLLDSRGDIESQEAKRTRHVASVLAKDIHINHLRGFEKNRMAEKAIVDEFERNVIDIQKSGFLGAVMLNQAFAGGVDTAGAHRNVNFGANDNMALAIEDMLESGVDGDVIAMKVRQAAGGVIAMQKQDTEERLQLEHNPAKMNEFRNEQAMNRAWEERYMLDRMGWTQD